jgi:hypothetical protein
MGKRKSLGFEAKIKRDLRDLSLKHGVSKSVISSRKKKTKKIYANGSAREPGNKKMKQSRASKFATMATIEGSAAKDIYNADKT